MLHLNKITNYLRTTLHCKHRSLVILSGDQTKVTRLQSHLLNENARWWNFTLSAVMTTTADIVWNAHNTVFGSKRFAICALAAYFMHLVGWSLASLFSPNMAISETKGQGWRVIFLLSEGRLAIY